MQLQLRKEVTNMTVDEIDELIDSEYSYASDWTIEEKLEVLQSNGIDAYIVSSYS